ncbi:hypothetical protein B6D19_07310 [Gilliamella apicola]|uniref:DUF4123 domain-containing protein n=1 Tax=Gilliamella apicola TaxID=1196095 RepID=UPI000A35950D|nr:DUF4123 domain-containing protein [Gilliamella apicola]OTQ31944.1 hypothetical protein B6D19_07310 [Gilliamella apicola]OTQ45698.1 hypothetical protein B6D20_03650 [Gilliamella apicola]
MIKNIAETDISNIIAKQINRFGKVYLLIDPKINDDFFFEHNFEFESIVPIRDRQDTVSQDHECLQLCTIRKGVSYVDQVISELKSNQSAAIALITSPHNIKSIQNHISNAMFMSYKAKYYFLRFYDPYVLKHLVNILNKKQLNQLLGVIQYWYYWQNSYIELHHKPELILSDIDYEITTNQWQKINIAQAYNAYEYQIMRQQNSPLSESQQNTLTLILEWIYKTSFDTPEQQKMDYIVNHVMEKSEQFFQKTTYNQFYNIMKNNNIYEIKQYLQQLEQE